MRTSKRSLLFWIWMVGAILGASRGMASETVVHLQKSPNDLCDKASLQRGAGLFMNYCSGCHSLQYVRFNGLAKDLGIVDKNGKVLEKLVEQNLNFITDKITSPIEVATPKKEADKWFGMAPPDLTLVARVRGTDWLYTYLHSFYEDPKQIWGVNNLVFQDVAMPNVLQGLQGTQVASFKTVTLLDDNGNPYEKEVVDQLSLKPGQGDTHLTKEAFDQVVIDLVNFLEYVGEPHKLDRQKLGVWVLLFLIIFTLFAYLLKREYWKDVR